ncbi:conjugal transfer protein [Kitasatospora kifunensis]|uniref:Conjugal transfer protein n=1 Tax=Kitasatospora kifunensis TaxID=58351 RepID=A0A7W7RAP8_KITKI|nr:conjugal transfer protein [Kitasatospora kifunensis]MBB4928503.1 hypothetical protein [Kitasatospora kifunensis]
MKRLLGRPWSAAAAERGAAEQGGVDRGEAGGGWSWSTGASANTAAVLRRALWGLVLLGPLLGGAALLTRPAAAGPVPAQAPVGAPATGGQGAAGFAEQFVAACVAAGDGDQAKLTPYFPGADDLRLEGASGGRSADQLVVVRLRQSDGDVWSVTVAARVSTAGGAGAGVVHYFQVPVAVGPTGGGGTGYVALAMPAEVAAPPRIQAPGLVYGPWRPALPGDPLTQAVSPALSAYLTGSGDLSRYLAPGARLAPISPAPYTALSVDQLAVEGEQDGAQAAAVPGDGIRLGVLVQVRATGTDGVRVPLSYALTLRTRAGRWEISSLDGAPAQAPASS